MLKETIIEIINEVWPMILICCVILVSMRIVYLYKNKEKLVLHKELTMLMFIIYIMCLFYVVTFQDVSWSSSNFILFKEIFRYEFGSKMFFRNVVGNMLMFIPYGFFVSFFLNIKKVSPILLMTFITSITIEVTQLLIGRVFDIDDILLNLIGGVIGFFIYLIGLKLGKHLPSWLKKSYVYSIIVVGIIIGSIAFLIGG